MTGTVAATAAGTVISNGSEPEALLGKERFDHQLHAELERARRGRRSFSLLLIHLDTPASRNGFGKELSNRAAGALLAQKRTVDVAGRIGENSYTMILPETDEAGALHAARRIRTEISRSLGSDADQAAVRVGVATFPRHARSGAGLFRAAESALSIAEDLLEAAPFLDGAELPVAVASVASNGEAPERQIIALQSLSETADVRARGRAGHSQRVARYAVLIGRELGLDDGFVRKLKTAAVLHDIGNVAIPERVLRKTGPLSEDDWEIVKSHPDVGARLLGSAGLEEVSEWVRGHHEHVDGSGYPGGLRCSAIPLAARIIAVADAFEAMTRERPHRVAVPEAAAEQELLECADSQFDRRVVEAFLRALARSKHTVPVASPA